MSGTLQIIGALLVLTPFSLVQAGRLQPQALPYLLLNLTGATILAVLAATHSQWGFLLLEGVWAAVAAAGVARFLRDSARRRTAAP